MLENDHGEGLLALDELLKFTGLNRNLLHAWERRYGLEPKRRSATGRRFYSLEQAERLLHLKRAVDAGHRISAISGLSLTELEALETREQPEQALKDFIDTARQLDAGRIAGLLRIRLRSQGLSDFVLKTVVPLLQHVGQLWSEGRLGVAGEHVVSVALKQVLLSGLLDQEVPEGSQKAVVTTLEGELHEFGALAAALLARLAGIDAVYLGPTLPVREVAAAASRLQARYVLVSTLVIPEESLISALDQLRQQLPDGITLIAGGRHLGKVRPTANLLVQPALEGLPGLLARLSEAN